MKVSTVKKIFAAGAVLAAAAVLFTGCNGDSGVEGKNSINIGTGGAAGTYHPIGTAMAEILTQEIYGTEANAQNTGASVVNLKMLGDGTLDLATVQNDIAHYAANGTEMFKDEKVDGLKGIPRHELPNPLTLLKERGHLAIPLVVIVYLLVSGYTPMRAALVAIVLSIVCAMLRKSTRMKPIEIVYGLERGAKAVLGVLIACAAAGIIIGVVTKTGVGLRLASGLIDLAGGMLLPAMFFTMITAIVLGMGVPTTANYVITSTIAAPALVQMGVPILAAHMFVFYFGIIADVTPPVALAAYAGAGISGGNALKTGVHASKLAVAAFIIPYIFVLSPVILMVDATPLTLIVATLSALAGMIAVSSALCGFLADHCRPYERLLLIIAGLLMIKPGGMTDLVGCAIFAAILAMQYRRMKAST